MGFKVGDRVECMVNEHFSGGKETLGKKGTVIKKQQFNFRFLYSVEFDNNVNGHDCNGLGRMGHCWNFDEFELKIIAENEPQPTTNYEIKSDQGKPRLSLVPINGIWKAIANIREYGVKKYTDTESWKQVEIQRYWDAVLRHIATCAVDMDAVDEESGMLHRWHVECNLAFIEELKGMV